MGRQEPRARAPAPAGLVGQGLPANSQNLTRLVGVTPLPRLAYGQSQRGVAPAKTSGCPFRGVEQAGAEIDPQRSALDTGQRRDYQSQPSPRWTSSTQNRVWHRWFPQGDEAAHRQNSMPTLVELLMKTNWADLHGCPQLRLFEIYDAETQEIRT